MDSFFHYFKLVRVRELLRAIGFIESICTLATTHTASQ